jgi:predicted RNA-binding protein with RPS1 domain
VVELNKEDYLLVSFKQSKSSIGLLMLQNLNNDQVPNPNEKYQIGDEVDVSVVSITESGFILIVPASQVAPAGQKTKAGTSQRQETSSLS